MDLLSIDEINDQYLFYESQRSARGYLSKKGLVIIRLGKKYFVQKIAFETLISGLTGFDIQPKAVCEKIKLNPDEQKILKSLQRGVREI